ncbi:unnamed protein product [Globisporangium polare]
MAKSLNPMNAFRREQKKKELKKHKTERQRDKKQKLATMDAEELKTQLKTLERQVQMNPADGPTRKRKQELEDTLNAVLKKQKEMEAEQEQEEQVQKEPKTIQELTEANKERYQNPENSVYYHPTLNPFGVPPPGRPQMYRVPPPVTAQARPQQQHARPYHANGPRPTRGGRGPPRYQGNRGTGHPPPPPPPASVEPPKRPGKRPPLPPGPPPPGTIQVPMRPPLPRGVLPFRPPPPPSASSSHAAPPPALAPHVPPPPPPAVPAQSFSALPPPPPPALVPHKDAQAEVGPVPPHPQAPDDTIEEGDESADAHDVPMDVEDEDTVVAPYPTMDMDDEDSVVAPYPTMDSPEDYGNGYDSDQQDANQTAPGFQGANNDEDDEEREEKQAQLRSLVPVALRVQRRAPGAASGVVRPRAAPTMNPVPRPASAMPVLSAPSPGAPPRVVTTAVGPAAPATATTAGASDGSVSKEYDAFMEEMRSLGAL